MASNPFKYSVGVNPAWLPGENAPKTFPRRRLPDGRTPRTYPVRNPKAVPNFPKPWRPPKVNFGRKAPLTFQPRG